MSLTWSSSGARALAIAIMAAAGVWATPISARASEPVPDALLAAQARALDLLERAGRALDGKRFAEAAALYRKAAALDPTDGQPLVLAGVAAYQVPAPTAARRDLRLALQRSLAAEDRELAQLYLGLIAAELEPPQPARDADEVAATVDAPDAWEVGLGTTFGGGYDSNARQSPPGSLDADGGSFAPAEGALYAAAAVELTLARGFGDGAEIELSYGVEQSAYGDRRFADLDFQEHVLSLALAQALGDAARVALTATGDLSFTGVGTALRPFQRSFRLDPELSVGRRELRLRLAGAWQRTSTLDPALSFLSGQRLEASLTPQLMLAGWRASFTARLRRDDLGSVRRGLDAADDPCLDCTTDTVIPYGNQGVAASARVSAPARWRLRPAASIRWDLRSYEQPQRTERQTPLGVEPLGSRLRRDVRLGAGASLTWRLGEAWSLGARYDYLRLDASYAQLQGTGCAPGTSCDPGADDRRGYRKHGLTIELAIDWS